MTFAFWLFMFLAVTDKTEMNNTTLVIFREQLIKNLTPKQNFALGKLLAKWF